MRLLWPFLRPSAPSTALSLPALFTTSLRPAMAVENSSPLPLLATVTMPLPNFLSISFCSALLTLCGVSLPSASASARTSSAISFCMLSSSVIWKRSAGVRFTALVSVRCVLPRFGFAALLVVSPSAESAISEDSLDTLSERSPSLLTMESCPPEIVTFVSRLACSFSCFWISAAMPLSSISERNESPDTKKLFKSIFTTEPPSAPCAAPTFSASTRSPVFCASISSCIWARFNVPAIRPLTLSAEEIL